MSRRHQRDLHAIAFDGLSVFHRFGRAGEILAIARGHDGQRLRRRHHRAMAGARVIGMAVRNHRTVHRPHGVDIEVAGGAVEPCRLGAKEGFGLGHGRHR